VARVLVLVDGEHYPPVVRDAIVQASAEHDVVAALLLGGREKLDGEPVYGVPLHRAGADAAAAMVSAAAEHSAQRVIDLSDEPVLSESGRLRLAAHALAAGLAYEGPDFEFRVPDRQSIDAPTLAVIGTGKRVGKTAVSAHAARVLAASGRDPVVVAMGRGGPAEPEPIDPGGRPIGVQDLLTRSRSGQHAASDFLEDAVVAGVPTVGARRCGGGLAGAPYLSNVWEAARLAAASAPGLVLLEGSGAAIPPVAADRTLLVTSAARAPDAFGSGLGPYRVLVSDMVVLTMCEPPLASPPQVERVRDAIHALRPELPVIATVLDPVPGEPLDGAQVTYFTTAPAEIHDRLAASLERSYGVHVQAVVGSLADRAVLRADLGRPEVAGADVFLVELKAAAVDVVAEAADRLGRRIVFCDNRPRALQGEADLDAALRDLAGEAVGAHA
jgi:cyclic 2,3-diphosphoglycerate synthase